MTFRHCFGYFYVTELPKHDKKQSKTNNYAVLRFVLTVIRGALIRREQTCTFGQGERDFWKLVYVLDLGLPSLFASDDEECCGYCAFILVYGQVGILTKECPDA
jgi:hypothetical protein